MDNLSLDIVNIKISLFDIFSLLAGEDNYKSVFQTEDRKYNQSSPKMCTGNLFQIHPPELRFPFELKKQISSSVQLRHNSINYIAFKVKTSNPKNYCVRPNNGVMLPQSSCDVIVTMIAQKETPPDMQCKDKFLIEYVILSPGVTANAITEEMFKVESGKESFKFRVVYVAPVQLPSPKAYVSEIGTTSMSSKLERELISAHLQLAARQVTITTLKTEHEKVVRELQSARLQLATLETKVNRLMKIIVVSFTGLVFWFILMKMLPSIWSFSILVTMLGVKMINKLVSDAVDGWVLNISVYICTYLISKICWSQSGHI